MLQLLTRTSTNYERDRDRPLSPQSIKDGFSSFRGTIKSKRSWAMDLAASSFFLPATTSPSLEEPGQNYSRVQTFKSGSVSLHLTSLDETSTRSTVPTFYPGERVRGNVILEFSKPRRAKKLWIRLEGFVATSCGVISYPNSPGHGRFSSQILSSSGSTPSSSPQRTTEWDKHVFLSTTYNLIDNSTSSTPPYPTSTPTSPTLNENRPECGFAKKRVEGSFEFPISFDIPTKAQCDCDWERVRKKSCCQPVIFGDGREGVQFNLPSSFIGKDGSGHLQYIGYRFVVELEKPGRPWNMVRRLTLPIVINAAHPGSEYISNSLNSRGTFPPLPGKQPNIWTVKKRKVDLNHLGPKMGVVEIQLSLPNPIELFIGDRVPFVLKLSSNLQPLESSSETLISSISISLQRSMEYTVRMEPFKDNKSVISGTIYGHQSLNLERGGSKEVTGELDLRAWNVDGDGVMLTQTISTCNLSVSWDLRVILQLPYRAGGRPPQCIDFPIQLFNKYGDAVVPNTYLDLTKSL